MGGACTRAASVHVPGTMRTSEPFKEYPVELSSLSPADPLGVSSDNLIVQNMETMSLADTETPKDDAMEIDKDEDVSSQAPSRSESVIWERRQMQEPAPRVLT
mmetsp:Transcript_17555/g.27156  ORF Transcript_17555/g.27156 Transcript_17555/m.27156 type:complete len:103 (+) Transcript_17555:137-445(+)